MWSGERVSGKNQNQLWRENKRLQIVNQEQQIEESYWTTFKGMFKMPKRKDNLDTWKEACALETWHCTIQ